MHGQMADGRCEDGRWQMADGLNGRWQNWQMAGGRCGPATGGRWQVTVIWRSLESVFITLTIKTDNTGFALGGSVATVKETQGTTGQLQWLLWCVHIVHPGATR
jgi:hypothetical protein